LEVTLGGSPKGGSLFAHGRRKKENNSKTKGRGKKLVPK